MPVSDSSTTNSNNEAASQPRVTSRRAFMLRMAKVGLVAAMPAGYGFWVEPDQIRVAESEIRLTDWPKSASGLRIGHLSDTHCDSDHEVERAERAARLLLQQKPDVVFLTGDYITRLAQPWSMRAAQ